MRKPQKRKLLEQLNQHLKYADILKKAGYDPKDQLRAAQELRRILVKDYKIKDQDLPPPITQ